VGENYTPPPKRPLAAFSGSGNRLGSPVPGHASEEVGGSMPGAFSTGSGSGSAGGGGAVREAAALKFEVDQSLPTTSVQIRLADGTR
jgi:UBX domain-containing protein 1